MYSVQGSATIEELEVTNGIHLHRLDLGYIPVVKTWPKLKKLTLSPVSNAESAFLNDGDLSSTLLIVAKWTNATQLIKVTHLEDLTINCQRGFLNPQVGDPSTRAIFELQNLSTVADNQTPHLLYLGNDL